MITREICKHLGCQCVHFLHCCLSANTRPQEKVSRENYEPCPQLSPGRSLYYGQIGSRAAQLWSCCLQPELPEEHKRAVRVGDNNSKVAQHANQFVHSMDFDHATVVDRARSFPKIKTRVDIL